MNRLLLAILIFSAGTFGFASLHQTTLQIVSKTMSDEARWLATTNRLASMSIDILALRKEVRDRKHHLQQLQAGLGNHLRLDDASEPRKKPGKPQSALADLRGEWRMGWNDSKDYVLVDKQVLKKINFEPVDSNGNLTEIGRVVLAASPEEAAGVKEAIRQARNECEDWVRAHVQRVEPSGEIVAQYTFPPDPTSGQSIFDKFSGSITAILGEERADILANPAWNSIRQESGTTGSETNTLIVRRDPTGQDSMLSYEYVNGSYSYIYKIEYGTAPPQSFHAMFPSWLDVARREGFGLSKDFRYIPRNGQ
jgi:hypothetical protein